MGKTLENLSKELTKLGNTVETIEDENQNAYDDMPEGLQSGEKGEALANAVDQLTNVRDNIDSAISSVDEAVDNLSAIE